MMSVACCSWRPEAKTSCESIPDVRGHGPEECTPAFQIKKAPREAGLSNFWLM